jgi:hypothetical protein
MRLLNGLGRSTAFAKTIGELGMNTGEFLDWYGHAQATIIVLSSIARARVLDLVLPARPGVHGLL